MGIEGSSPITGGHFPFLMLLHCTSLNSVFRVYIDTEEAKYVFSARLSSLKLNMCFRHVCLYWSNLTNMSEQISLRKWFNVLSKQISIRKHLNMYVQSRYRYGCDKISISREYIVTEVIKRIFRAYIFTEAVKYMHLFSEHISFRKWLHMYCQGICRYYGSDYICIFRAYIVTDVITYVFSEHISLRKWLNMHISVLKQLYIFFQITVYIVTEVILKICIFRANMFTETVKYVFLEQTSSWKWLNMYI